MMAKGSSPNSNSKKIFRMYPLSFMAFILSFVFVFPFPVFAESGTEIVPVVPDYGELPDDVYPGYSVPDSGGYTVSNSAGWLTDAWNLGKRLGTAAAGFVDAIFGDGDVCPASDNGSHDFVIQFTQVGSDYGYYFVCRYCGKHLSIDFDQSYQDYVEDELPAPQVDHEGYLYWSPKHDYLAYTKNNVSYPTVFCSHHEGGSDSGVADNVSYDFSVNNGIGRIYLHVANDTTSFFAQNLKFFSLWSEVVPYAGYYSLTADTDFIMTPVTPSLVNLGESSKTHQDGAEVGYADGATLTYSCAMYYSSYYDYRTYQSLSECLCYAIAPVYRIRPYSGLINVSTDETYNPGSRVGSITGDYAVVGEGNELTIVEDQQIVNETDNSVYNPVTNTTYEMTGWQYDYSTRTYNITYETIEEGDTVTNDMSVTYGDSYVEIHEGDTVYNVYYVIPSQSSGDDNGNTGNDSNTGSDTPSVNVDVPGGLVALRNKLVTFYNTLPQMFGDFNEFLSDAFSYIPSEIMSLITFGVAAAVAVGVFKLFWR